MSSITRFEDIVTWQKTRRLTIDIYDVLKRSQDYGYKDQLQRASVSIMNNIAEGYERLGDKQLRHFLYIAKGSAGEVRSLIILGKDLGYFNNDQATDLYERAYEISKMLSGFIKKLDIPKT